MAIRIGRVTSVYPSEGRVKVAYEDSRSSSLPLAMMTMNNEYSLPKVGDRVVTVHMDNGSSKGFVLGTYFGGGSQPKANSGYRKDFSDSCYVICNGGVYSLNGADIKLRGSGAAVLLAENAAVTGLEAVLGSALSEEEGADPDSYFKATSDNAEIKGKTEAKIEAENITLKCSYGTFTVEEIVKRLERIEDQLGLPHTI